MVILFCIISAALASSSEATSANKTISLSLTPIISPSIYINHEYTSLFKIEIKNKSSCSSPKDTVTIAYNISRENSLLKKDSFTKEIGCTSSASTGSFTVTEAGNYTLCGTITNSSINGTVPSLVSCMDFTALSTSEISCDLNLQLKANETIFYQNSQSIEFKPQLNNNSFPFVIEYWIEDLFGKIVKPKINTTNTNEKSWKTNIEEQDQVLFLKAIVYPSCNDLDLSNNFVQEMFIVINNELGTKGSSAKTSSATKASSDSTANSTIKIIKISPETITFGKTVDVEIEIYKGATNKYSLSVWAEKSGKVISEKTKVHLKDKNTLYQLMLPVQLQPNCKEKIKDGDATLIVEGLGLQEEKEFTLEGLNGDLCPKKEAKDETEKEPTTEKSKSTSKTNQQTEKTKTANQSFSLLSQPDTSGSFLSDGKAQKKEVSDYDGIVVYESVSEKSKKLSSWALVTGFGLLCLILVLRKHSD